MADTKRYQVVSACVLLPVREADGSEVFHTIYRPATFQADPDNYRVRYNVDSGYIVEIGAAAVAGVDNSGTPLVDDKPTVGDGEPGDPVFLNDPGTVNEAAHQAVAEARGEGEPKKVGRPSAAEKAKLVDEAVAAGMDKTEAEKASVGDLRAALKK